jgi:hypothetical protein
VARMDADPRRARASLSSIPASSRTAQLYGPAPPPPQHREGLTCGASVTTDSSLPASASSPTSRSAAVPARPRSKTTRTRALGFAAAPRPPSIAPPVGVASMLTRARSFSSGHLPRERAHRWPWLFSDPLHRADRALEVSKGAPAARRRQRGTPDLVQAVDRRIAVQVSLCRSLDAIPVDQHRPSRLQGSRPEHRPNKIDDRPSMLYHACQCIDSSSSSASPP